MFDEVKWNKFSDNIPEWLSSILPEFSSAMFVDNVFPKFYHTAGIATQNINLKN